MQFSSCQPALLIGALAVFMDLASAGAPGSIFNAYQRLPERERRQNGRPPPGGGGGGTAGAPGALSSNNGAHACPVLGSVAFASVAVSSADKSTGKFNSNANSGTGGIGEDIFGPMEAGFTSQQDGQLANLGCTTGFGYLDGGIDTLTAQSIVAKDCGVALPRWEGNRYVAILDQCGGHTNDYHFHEELICLYDSSASGHSTKVGETANGQSLYGKWEDTNVLPALDACAGHVGVTPDNSAATYHYHVQGTAPFTIGCYGPNDDNSLVTTQQCRDFYGECDGVLSTYSLADGRTIQYDNYCPCYDAAGSNTGVNIQEHSVFSVTAAPVTAAPVTAAPATQAAVTTIHSSGKRTCAQLGWTKIVNNVCGESDKLGISGAASVCKEATLADAIATCDAAGTRLCTVDEIDSGVTASTGCGYDTTYTWTSTWCGLGPEGGKFYVGMGGGGIPSDRKCKNPKKSYPVRCCSDVDLTATTAAPATTTTTFPFLSERKNCAALGWQVTGNACGESDKAFKKGLDKCFTWKNHPDAERKCLKLGGRMCAQADIESGVGISTGCSFDNAFLWTSTSCGANSYIQAKGNAKGETQCAIAKSKGPMRCCSDVNLSGNFVVTAAGGAFYIDGTMGQAIHLIKGQFYTFDVSSTTMATHPFLFSTTSDGTHGGGSQYTNGVSSSGTRGQSGATVTIAVNEDVALHYYCGFHAGMGASVNVFRDDTRFTHPAQNFRDRRESRKLPPVGEAEAREASATAEVRHTVVFDQPAPLTPESATSVDSDRNSAELRQAPIPLIPESDLAEGRHNHGQNVKPSPLTPESERAEAKQNPCALMRCPSDTVCTVQQAECITEPCDDGAACVSVDKIHAVGAPAPLTPESDAASAQNRQTPAPLIPDVESVPPNNFGGRLKPAPLTPESTGNTAEVYRGAN